MERQVGTTSYYVQVVSLLQCCSWNPYSSR